MPSDYRCIRPIKSNCASPQTHDPKRRPVLCLGEATGKIKFDIRTRSRTGNGRAKRLDTNLRLTHGCAERTARREKATRNGQLWKIRVVHGPTLTVRIEQNYSRQQSPIL